MKIIKRHIALFLAIVMILSLAGCSGAASSGPDEATAASQTAASQTEAAQTASGTDEAQARVYSGELSAADKREIIPTATGKILECPYNVGDTVKAGDLLYRLDDGGLADSISTTQISLEKAELSVSTAQDNIADLKIYAPADGILENFDVKEGERVSPGKLGDIVDEGKIIATVPFLAGDAARIKTGDGAVLTSALQMADIRGTVTMVYDRTETREDGSALRSVEITADNPGGFVSGSGVSAVVTSSGGEITSAVAGTAECGERVSLVGRASGYAKTVSVKSGQSVKAGQLILELENESLLSTARRAQLDSESLEIRLASLREDYADCSLYSPISGVVTEKNKAANESVTSESDPVMTVSDISSLTVTLYVEKDDMAYFAAGAEIALAADSSEHPEITGAVTSVGTEGRVRDGTVCYPVTVTVENTFSLMPGTQVSVTLQ